MLKIALCDDEMEQQNMMALLTAEYFNGNANLKMYSDGRKLLDIVDWNGPDVFDLYILDIRTLTENLDTIISDIP